MLVWVPGDRGPRSLADVNPSSLWPRDWERDGTSIAFHTGVLPAELGAWLSDSSLTWVAHNAAGFDAPACARLLPRGGRLKWFDTMPCAMASGLPGGLDALGRQLLGRGKDKGKDALKLLYRAKYVGQSVVYPVGTQALWESMLRYNVADVLLLREVFAEVRLAVEPAVWEAHRAVNERGVAYDRRLALRLIDLGEELAASRGGLLPGLTDGELAADDMRSHVKVKRWLASRGLRVESLERQKLERMYYDPEEFFGDVPDDVDLSVVVEVLRIRQQMNRSIGGKLKRVVSSACPDGRVRDTFVYHGAHTGRWTGRGFQPHNMPRGVGELDVEDLMSTHEADTLSLSDVEREAGDSRASIDDCLSTLIRPVFTGNLVVADYSQVEARCVAWLAECHSLLRLFTGPDVYCEMASRIFGRPVTKADAAARFLGKETVLGCGYGMSPNKFAVRCKLKGVDLAASGTSAEACVGAYRESFPEISGSPCGKWRSGGLWKDYGSAVMRCVSTGTLTTAGKCGFEMRGPHMRLALPSGRALVYRDAKVEDVVPSYCEPLGLPLVARPAVTYLTARGWRQSLYGALIAENVSQGACRDIMAGALCQLQDVCVMHVHDELVLEVPPVSATRDWLHFAAQVMSAPPAWAAGFPLAVEAFESPRYVKSPYKGARRVRALNGEVL